MQGPMLERERSLKKRARTGEPGAEVVPGAETRARARGRDGLAACRQMSDQHENRA